MNDKPHENGKAEETGIALRFVSVRNSLPPSDGTRYSVPVLVANAVTGQIFDQIVQYDFEERRWVYYGLPNGNDPSDCEICNVTHWFSIHDRSLVVL